MDVVVAVDEDGFLGRRMSVSREDHRVARGLVKMSFEAHSAQLPHEPLGAGAHILLVAGIGGNAGETEEGEKVFELRSHGPTLQH